MHVSQILSTSTVKKPAFNCCGCMMRRAAVLIYSDSGRARYKISISTVIDTHTLTGMIRNMKSMKMIAINKSAEDNLGTRSLFFYNCFCRANILTGTTLSAIILIDFIDIVTFIDGIGRTLLSTGSTSYTFICNFKSHNITPFINKIVFNGTFRLKFENLFLFIGRDGITLIDMSIGNFLNLIVDFKVLVLGNLLVIFQFFQFFINVSSMIPH